MHELFDTLIFSATRSNIKYDAFVHSPKSGGKMEELKLFILRKKLADILKQELLQKIKNLTTIMNILCELILPPVHMGENKMIYLLESDALVLNTAKKMALKVEETLVIQWSDQRIYDALNHSLSLPTIINVKKRLIAAGIFIPREKKQRGVIDFEIKENVPFEIVKRLPKGDFQSEKRSDDIEFPRYPQIAKLGETNFPPAVTNFIKELGAEITRCRCQMEELERIKAELEERIKKLTEAQNLLAPMT